MYRVGFTGTQEGMTDHQKEVVRYRLDFLIKEHKGEAEFHHGDCVGADEQAFELAAALGYKTVAHPGPTGPKRAYTNSDVVLPQRPYMDRNEDIAFVCDLLIAAPKEQEEQQRSGTWSTVRRGRKFYKPIEIYVPAENPRRGSMDMD